MQSSKMRPEELDQVLRAAIESNTAQAVEAVLLKKASPNWVAPVVPKKGLAWVLSLVQPAEQKLLSPLHLAVRKRNLAIVKLLLYYGANESVVDDAGFTPIAVAAINGSWDIVRAMIYPGVYHPVTKPDPFQYNATLFYVLQAGQYDLARALLEAGATTNFRDSDDNLSVKDLLNLPVKIKDMIESGYEEVLKQKKEREIAALENAKNEFVSTIEQKAKGVKPERVLLGFLKMDSQPVLKGTEEALKPFYAYLLTVLRLPSLSKTTHRLRSLAKKVMHTTESIPKSLRAVYEAPEEKKPTDLYVKVNVALKMKEHAEADSPLDKAMDRQLPALLYALLKEYEAHNEPSKALALLLEHGQVIAGSFKDDKEFPHLLAHIEKLITMDTFPKALESQLDMKIECAASDTLKGKYALLVSVFGVVKINSTFYKAVDKVAKLYWQQFYVETLLSMLQGSEYSANLTPKFLDYFASITAPAGPDLPEPLKKAVAETPADQKRFVVDGDDRVTLCKRLQQQLRDTQGTERFGLFKQEVDRVVASADSKQEASVPAASDKEEPGGKLDLSFLPSPQ